jgi:hypothetical protein
MQTNTPHPEHAAAVDAKSAAELLQALEALREELGGIADDIITLLRGAGVTPPTH